MIVTRKDPDRVLNHLRNPEPLNPKPLEEVNDRRKIPEPDSKFSLDRVPVNRLEICIPN